MTQPDKYPRHSAVVAWALKELGVHEEPMGSNRGKRVQVYQDQDWLPGTGYPWCAAFCCAAWKLGGKRPLPWPTAGAYDMGNRARASGWTVQSVDRLVPGDIVVWHVGQGHVSLFISYKRAANIVVTLDGNVNDQVAYRERPLSLARDLIHVPEIGKAVPAKTVTPPVFQVVSSETEKVIYVSGARAVGRNLAKILKRHPSGVVIRRKKQ